jgi:hypothetical protein
VLRNNFEGTLCGWEYNFKRNAGGMGCGVERIHIGQNRFEM